MCHLLLRVTWTAAAAAVQIIVNIVVVAVIYRIPSPWTKIFTDDKRKIDHGRIDDERCIVFDWKPRKTNGEKKWTENDRENTARRHCRYSRTDAPAVRLTGGRVIVLVSGVAWQYHVDTCFTVLLPVQPTTAAVVRVHSADSSAANSTAEDDGKVDRRYIIRLPSTRRCYVSCIFYFFFISEIPKNSFAFVSVLKYI